MNILSIGTVAKLKNGERKLMITSRTPLKNEIKDIKYPKLSVRAALCDFWDAINPFNWEW